MAFPKQKRSEAAYWISSIVIGFSYLLPYVLFGTSSHILIHDNLDAPYVWYKLLIESGSLFAPNGTPIEQIFNGLPREALPQNSMHLCSCIGSSDLMERMFSTAPS